MMRWRLFHPLLLLVAAILIAAGPGGPLCTAALARTDAPAMAGCDMPRPAKGQSLPSHPDCAAPCIGIACPAPGLVAVRPAKQTPPDSPVLRLAGIAPPPETEPPRS